MKRTKSLLILLSVLSISLSSCNSDQYAISLDKFYSYIETHGLDMTHWEGVKCQYNDYWYEYKDGERTDKHSQGYYLYLYKTDTGFECYINLYYNEYILDYYPPVTTEYDFYINEESISVCTNPSASTFYEEEQYEIYTYENTDITFDTLYSVKDKYFEGIPEYLKNLVNYTDKSDYTLACHEYDLSTHTQIRVSLDGTSYFDEYKVITSDITSFIYDPDDYFDYYWISRTTDIVYNNGDDLYNDVYQSVERFNGPLPTRKWMESI
ncbi:MAG: hypothetical protein LUD22_03025 [Coprobacillus sp.]|nr:hypothetical protein [Coprobacillus sp.]